MSPYAPKRPCVHPGCGKLTDTGRCDTHKRQQMQAINRERGGSTKQGYGFKWQKAREVYLRDHPLCMLCHASGTLRAASVVDHKQPHKGDMTKFWDQGNWQALCKRCHDSKTARDDGRWVGVGQISRAEAR
jgi:5-methylcytosine-specific restriction enzyme A